VLRFVYNHAMLIDTHCHLTYPGLIENVRAVIDRAAATGVTRIITIGTDAADHARVVNLLADHPTLCAALGFHPHHGDQVAPADVAALEPTFRANPRNVAIGECGLDYFAGHGPIIPKPLQEEIFRAHIALAKTLGRPMILHIRDAHEDALKIMREFTDVPYVVHCFTGTAKECSAWLDRGAYIGITGIVTYKNAGNVREAAALIPLDHLLVETDAPYLSPEPVRKIKTNEPAFVAHVARYLATLRQLMPDDLAEKTTANAIRLFGASLHAKPDSPAA
jgi:TatD DNase family protein